MEHLLNITDKLEFFISLEYEYTVQCRVKKHHVCKVLYVYIIGL